MNADNNKIKDAIYKDIFEKSNIAILIDGIQGEFKYFNQKFADLFGYSFDEMKTNSIQDIIHPDDLPRVMGYHRNRLLDLKTPARYEFRGLKKDRSIIYIEVDVSPFEKNGKYLGTLSYIWDVTQRKQLEKENINSRNMETVSRLAGGIAHEFNNLLTIISGFSEVLLKSISQNDANYQKINQILKAGKRAEILTRQLLAFSNSLKFQPRNIELNKLIKRNRKKIQETLNQDIHLNLDLTAFKTNIYADPVQIEEIIFNLLQNASDALPDGGKIRIRTNKMTLDENNNNKYPAVELGDYIILSVQDNGLGMNRETLGKIFEPFYSTKEEGKGTGLGLSVVYAIVKQYNGIIDVQSEPKQGTIVNVMLPHAKIKENLKRKFYLQHNFVNLKLP